MAWHYPLTFDSQGAFLRMCSVSFVPTKRGWRSFNPFKEVFGSLCPFHDYDLKVFTRDKHWLFSLFLLLLPFQRANRRLTVNALIGAHLSLVSGNASSCRHPAWSPLLCAPMKCKQEARYKCLTWSHNSFPVPITKPDAQQAFNKCVVKKQCLNEWTNER